MKQLAFGTMRMLEHSDLPEFWAKFLAELHGMNIRCLHSSSEYESFGLLCKSLSLFNARYPDKRFQHIVKLAEPSFDDGGFDAERLQQKLSAYSQSLGVERIDICQWMWRSDLKDETTRLREFSQAASEIKRTFAATIAAGLAVKFSCFPYTVECAELALEHGLVESLAVYRNPLETEYTGVLERCPANSSVVIRPYFAGKAFAPDQSVAQLLDFAFAPAAVGWVVVTATQPGHLIELGRYLNEKVV